MKLSYLFIGLAACWLSGCASTLPSSATQSTTPSASTVLISIDGLHPDVLGKGNTPHLDRLASNGTQARWMTPSYPSITFPNHYTLVTGLRPDRHGVIHNQMEDVELGRFELKDLDAVREPRWWSDALPVWIQASRQGLRSASWAFPGGETAIDGQLPDVIHPYDESVTPDARMEQVVDWLSQPQPLHFVAGYFEHVDQAGHAYGPGSEIHGKAVRRVDNAIGTLINGLEKQNLLDKVNLIIVSDHGMATVPDGQTIAVSRMVDPSVARAVTVGQVVMFDPLPGQEVNARTRLLGKHDLYECWSRETIPTHWHFGTHRRIPAIVCQMQEGWDALHDTAIAKRRPGARGSHGYDPALPAMRATFIAHGPAFRQGATIAPIDNVDVYPLITHLLGIKATEHDGDPEATRAALR